jgi:nitroimidazol reductase NimA-like FMN-containing flavoprotein (pyridoxamine 5'-phosphate oxidase superfamily)
MDKKKKKYSKPDIKKIRLDAKTAVLGFCKTGSDAGPSAFGCSGLGGADPCSAPGS